MQINPAIAAKIFVTDCLIYKPVRYAFSGVYLFVGHTAIVTLFKIVIVAGVIASHFASFVSFAVMEYSKRAYWLFHLLPINFFDLNDIRTALGSWLHNTWFA